ncbi:hypothetical protein GOBAR_AA02122 [Gossypium barbadense]|uniref:Uncharacterized protein n=1 Tax=Gossypium barbadense TaxID=3634 RepID=A0A2P5YS79_GOSBA|nr:hypothetical protein GOBAR_AA02122 [Gossypium barbadense]
MLSKFISVLEIDFENTETVLKNQQASIRRLETQIGQLAKLISERPQGSLPSNTESNPMEQLNEITSQDEEGELTLCVGDETITLQARNSGNTSKIEDAADPHIVTAKPNEEIPLTVLSIFPFGTVEASHPKFSTFKVYHTDTAKNKGIFRTVWKQGKDFPQHGLR